MIQFPAAAAASGAGAAAGTAAGGVPSWIIQLALGLFGSLDLDGGQKDFWKDPDFAGDARGMSAALINAGIRPPYQSKNLPGLEKMIMTLLSGQMGRSGNWGYPGGSQQMDLSFIMDMLDKMKFGIPGERRLIGQPNPNPPGDTVSFDSLSPRRPVG